jgi:nucleoside-diphosphate-sugar epimerase
VNNSPSIFATGVSGTIGKHFADKVLEINLDLLKPTKIFIPLIKPGDLILHAAAVVGSINVRKDVASSYLVNVKSSIRLAQFAKDLGVSKFVYVSTSHVYAKSNEILNEDSTTFPNNVYAEQKLEAEQGIAQIFSDSPEKLCIVRVFSVLDWDVADFTLGGAIKKLILPNSDFILSNADDVRDFLTPRKIATCLISIANCRSLHGIVNLSTCTAVTIREAALIMLEQSGFKLPKDRIIGGCSDFPYIVGDNSKIKSFIPDLDLTWKPTHRSQSISKS